MACLREGELVLCLDGVGCRDRLPDDGLGDGVVSIFGGVMLGEVVCCHGG